MKVANIETEVCLNSLKNFVCSFVHKVLVLQVTPEAKKKASEAKARGDDAFKRSDFSAAVDAYTQVYVLCSLRF